MSALDQLDRPLPPIARLVLIAEVLVLYVRVRLGWRRRPLPELLEALRAPRRRRPPPDHPAAPYRLARVAERVTGRLPDDSRCLVSSLVLTGLLARRSVPTSLVIGVVGEAPFRAHAWVEHQGAPLLDPRTGEFERLTEL